MKFNINKIKEPFVLVLIGHPLVGKSTFVKSLYGKLDFTKISNDDILMEMYAAAGHTDNDYNNAYKISNYKNIKSEFRKRQKNAIDNNINVIIDNTNVSSKKRRAALIDYKGYNCYAVVFPELSDKEIEIRNEKRSREENKFMSSSVIKMMKDSYQPPSRDEGFHEIFDI